ncbi:hypothetical protein BDV96DRAFT_665020 [Lophiotrema nucula]|uniref:Uncharacterized protein n=1 Tax=Lophiotrema nucula TaxID=690887 RepID=A0A6A5YXT6_9PLEO|nr:hypothetical protein BDV96DRAFT_665020 [Lophiotrema nucula]
MASTQTLGLGTARDLNTANTLAAKQSSSLDRSNQHSQEPADGPKLHMPTGTTLMRLLQNQKCKTRKTQTSRDVLGGKLKEATDEIALLKQIIEEKDGAFHTTQEETKWIQQYITNFAESIFSDCVEDGDSGLRELTTEFLTCYAESRSSSECSSQDGNSSDSNASSDTKATSICESVISSTDLLEVNEDLNKALLFTRKLKSAFVKASADRDDCKTRYQRQLRNRENDYQKLQECAAANQRLSNDYDEMEKELKEEVAAKEQELQLLSGSLKDQEVLKAQTADKYRKILKKKDQELESAKKETAEALERAGSEHAKQQRELMEATNTIQAKMRSEITSVQSQVRTLEAELQDNGTQTQAEIQSLTARNLQLHDELVTLKQCKTQGYPYQEQIGALMNSTETVRTELVGTKRELRNANNDKAALLDDIQRSLDQVNCHLERERAAQKDSAAMERKAIELAESNSRKDTLIKQLSSDITSSASDGTSGTVMSENKMQSGARTKSVALLAILEESDQLRAALKAEQEAKAVIVAKASKLEDEVFRREVEEQFIEAVQYRAKQEIYDLEQTCEMHNRTICTLEGNLLQSSQVPGSDKAIIVQHLDETKQEITRLRARQDPLEKELEEAKQAAETVEDRMDTKIKEANKWAGYWCDATFAALTQTESLHEQIATLMQEKGEKYYVESDHPYNKAVADRNALREACRAGVPAGVEFEDQWPGSISATYVALRKLRPLGWEVLYELGKVWLTPLVKPYTEEDALERRQAQAEQERMAHRKKMGFPVGEGLAKPAPSNTASRANTTLYAAPNQQMGQAKRQRCAGQLDAAKARLPQKTSTTSSIHSSALSLSYDPRADNFRSRMEYNDMTRAQKQAYQKFMVEEGRAWRKDT